METVHCLFCTSLCSPHFPFVNRNVMDLARVKNEVLITPDHCDDNDNYNDNHSGVYDKESENLVFDGEPSSIQAHLNTFFILRKILKISQENLCNLLQQSGGGGDDDDDLRVKICASCGKSVKLFFETLKQISKLRRRLNGIEKGLKGKIYESKFFIGGNPELGYLGIFKLCGNPTWNCIRSEVLIGDDDSSEEININGMPADKGQSQPDFKVAQDFEPFHAHEEAYQNEDMDEEYKVVLKETSEVEEAEDIPTFQTSTTTEDYTTFHRGKQKYFQCIKCPAEACNMKRFKQHLSLHEEGSSAIPCQECGWLVLPEAMHLHKGLRHGDPLKLPPKGKTTPSQLLAKKSHKQPKKKKKRRQRTTSPILAPSGDYATFHRGKQKYFQCAKCPAEACRMNRIRKHLSLHEEGSGAIPCEECGWFVMPEGIKVHIGLRHGEPLKRSPEKVGLYLKCLDCSALFSSYPAYRKHENLHEQGRGEVCQECGWLCNKLTSHNSLWHDNHKDSQ